MPELIAIAGGESAFGEAGGQSPWISLSELAAADPDVILIAPCGYGIGKASAEMAVLNREPVWLQLRAVHEGRVFVSDGNTSTGLGPRVVASAEITAEILHPGVAGRGHMGKSVVRHRAGLI